MQTQMTTFRVFLKGCEDFNAVSSRLHEKVRVPKLDRDEDVTDRKLSAERAMEILEYLDESRYASRDRAMFRLLFRAGLRTGR